MASEPLNELTFVARLGTQTALRAQAKRERGEAVLIETGEVEEKQIDGAGRVRRCDIRLNSRSRRKLASGEVKRPEVPEGRDPRNPVLVEDARRKAIARGLPLYFTCNMADVVLFAVATRPGEPDQEETSIKLAPIRHSREVDANWELIAANWEVFLDDLEARLRAVAATRPSVTSTDILALRNQIYAVADEAITRVQKRVEADTDFANRLRSEAEDALGFAPALKPAFRAQFHDELVQLLRFGIFVVAQKLVLYRVLQDAGPRRAKPFALDQLALPEHSSDPNQIRGILDLAFEHATTRSRDYQTAFSPTTFAEIVFLTPESSADVEDCRVGEVWHGLLKAVSAASWVSISQNLVGFLYEIIVDPQFRHQLGQFYTREDVVDLLTTFAIRDATDVVLDPAAGGGSFLRAAYRRKRALGEDHETALDQTWGTEITAFAAELSTIALATSDTSEPAAYPRVLLTDFFEVTPGIETRIPGLTGPVRIPKGFSAIVGNPPYISYRRQTNQVRVLNALAKMPREIELPKFSGKSDAYVWFIAYATRFLIQGGRLGFVVSSAMLFADYGIPLIRFIGRHYRVRAVVDSLVERWFPDADTNTVLLLLERETDAAERARNPVRFIRLRRPLTSLLPGIDAGDRRDGVEQFVDSLLTSEGGDDPRMMTNIVLQGADAGLVFVDDESTDELALDDGEDE